MKGLRALFVSTFIVGALLLVLVVFTAKNAGSAPLSGQDTLAFLASIGLMVFGAGGNSLFYKK